MNAPFVTIVSGLPRSGTSLLMQMLDAGGLPILTDSIRAADESNRGGYMEYEPVKQIGREASWYASAPGRAVKITIPLLMSIPQHPPARVLLLSRDLTEVAASQCTMLARLGKPQRYSTDALVPALAALIQRADSFLAARPDIRVLRLNFRDFLHHPATAALEVASFLDASLDTAAMATCVNPEWSMAGAPPALR